jgi:hypothetical protein
MKGITMKRVFTLIFTLALCLCAAQFAVSQKQKKQGQKPKIQPARCIDCDPEPTPTPTPTPPSCTSPNPIDDATFFVQQQYRDFLYRDPSGAELANDVAPLNSCLLAGDFACYNTERVHMSRRMWDKTEFRQQSRTFGLPLTQGFEHYSDDDFVELEYLIYLQRASSDPPDDYRRLGFYFWLGSLDNCVTNSGSYQASDQCYNDSINAFLHSTEYRSRFGCP